MHSFKENIKKCIEIMKTYEPHDVKDVDYTCGKAPVKKDPLDLDWYHGPIFCDNIILWSIEKDKNDTNPDKDKDWRIYIYNKCTQFFGRENFELKQLRSDILKGDDIAPDTTASKYPFLRYPLSS